METIFQILKQVSCSWKWGSQVCNSQVSWRTCTLSSDFYPLSVGTGPKGGSLSSHLLLTRWLSAVGLLLTQQVYGGQGPLVSAFQTARPCSGSSWGLPGSLTLHPGLIPSKLPARVDLTAAGSRHPPKALSSQQPEASGWGVQVTKESIELGGSGETKSSHLKPQRSKI